MRKNNKALIFTSNVQRLCKFLVFVSFFILFCCESYRVALEEQYFQRGQIAFEKKEYNRALEFFHNAQEVSVNTVARYRMAEIYLIQDNFEEARKLINRLLFIDRDNTLAHELNILWHIKKNNRKKVMQLYEKLISEDIRMGGRAYANIAVFYLNGKEYKTALEFFRKADATGEKSVGMLIAYLATLRLYTRSESEISEEDNAKPTEDVAEMQSTEESASTPIPQHVDEQNLTPTATQNDALRKETEQATKTHADEKKSTQQNDRQRDKSTSPDEVSEATVKLREDIRVDMDRVVSQFLELYEKNEVSASVLMQAAKDLESDTFFVYAFALYKAIAEKKNEEETSEEDINTASLVDSATRVNAYRALVTLIAKKQYHVSDEHAPLTILTYVEEIFKILFPRDEDLIVEYTNSLFDLLEMEEITDVLKTKLQELYDEYKIVKPEEPKVPVEELEELEVKDTKPR